jgi:serine/threonine protein kinase
MISSGDVAELKSELKLLRKMNHPNVVRYYGTVLVQDSIGLVFEFCKLGSLDHLIQKKTVPAPQLVKYCGHLAFGIEALHKERIVHRDIAAR